MRLGPEDLAWFIEQEFTGERMQEVMLEIISQYVIAIAAAMRDDVIMVCVVRDGVDRTAVTEMRRAAGVGSLNSGVAEINFPHYDGSMLWITGTTWVKWA